MMQDLKNTVIDVLKQDTRFISQEGDLLKNTVRHFAEKLDENLIGILLSNDNLREVFFIKIKDCLVFNASKFIGFINNKEFLPDSYTAFSNTIGLVNRRGDFISDSNEVVLSFPFKDGVLAGGQDKEDAKRNEVFYNEILARDDIDRLLDKKVFTNFKKFDKTGEKELDGFKRDKTGIIKDNLIIKGNNLIALHSLESEFGGHLDLIYIDPPYNTGGNGDTFEYNNKFKHSTWLAFMNNRLKIAKKLLKKDGVLIVAIDENEQTYLGVLLNEIFDEHETHCISIVHNPRGIQGTNFSYTNEFAFFVIPKSKKSVGNRKIKDDEIDWSKLRNWGSESERKDAKNCFYPVIVENGNIIGFGDVVDDKIHPKQTEKVGDKYYVYPIDIGGVERKWRYARQSVDAIKNLLRAKKIDGGYDIEIGKDFGQYKTVWIDNRYDSNEYGTKLVKDLVPGCKFSFPKSLWNVYDCVYAIVADNKEARVLDFFGGSGTTGHAVLELNEKDEGQRQFILIEQMDYITDVTAPRVHQVIKNKGVGDFVYMELIKSNQIYIDDIQDATTDASLLKIYENIKQSGFINYLVDIKSIDANIKAFEQLSIDNKKRFLFEILDKNMLYVNQSEINDKNYNVSDTDKKKNKDFYAK